MHRLDTKGSEMERLISEVAGSSKIELIGYTEHEADLRLSDRSIVVVVERTTPYGEPHEERGAWMASGYDRSGKRRVAAGYGSNPTKALSGIRVAKRKVF